MSPRSLAAVLISDRPARRSRLPSLFSCRRATSRNKLLVYFSLLSFPHFFSPVLSVILALCFLVDADKNRTLDQRDDTSSRIGGTFFFLSPFFSGTTDQFAVCLPVPRFRRGKELRKKLVTLAADRYPS